MTTATPAQNNHNTQALHQARELNYGWKQPVYCAIDKDGNIYDLSIGEPVFSQNYIYDERGDNATKRDQVNKREAEAKESYRFTPVYVGKNTVEFTFEIDGEIFEGEWSKKGNSAKNYYRYMGLKAETFSALIEKIK